MPTKRTQIDELWEPVDETFDNGAFETVCRSVPHASYSSMILKARDVVLLPRLTAEDSSRNNNSSRSSTPDKIDIFGGMDAEKAHLVPHAPICSATWGIICQAVVGVDFESEVHDRNRLILTLQQLVCGRVGEGKRSSGMRYSPLNLIYLAAPHKNYFDRNPALMVVPIMDLEEMKAWQEGQAYWVICIPGQCDGYHATVRQLNSKIFGDAAPSSTRCTVDELDKATHLLGACIKAHAAVLTRDSPALIPSDLLHGAGPDTESRRQLLLGTRNKLRASGTVTVPSVKSTRGIIENRLKHLMKVRLTQNIPDPALCVLRAAVSWSSRFDQKLLPACPDGPDKDEGDSEDKELLALGEEELEESRAMNFNPVGQTIDVVAPESSSRPVTVSPDKEAKRSLPFKVLKGKADDTDWENLDDIE
jgi:hypothetical protein